MEGWKEDGEEWRIFWEWKMGKFSYGLIYDLTGARVNMKVGDFEWWTIIFIEIDVTLTLTQFYLLLFYFFNSFLFYFLRKKEELWSWGHVAFPQPTRVVVCERPHFSPLSVCPFLCKFIRILKFITNYFVAEK